MVKVLKSINPSQQQDNFRFLGEKTVHFFTLTGVDSMRAWLPHCQVGAPVYVILCHRFLVSLGKV